MARNKLHSLGDNHLAAIRMKVEGRNCRQIAEVVGVELRTVYLWFGDPLVKAELERVRGRIFELFAERVTDLGMQALGRLEDLLEMPLEQEHITIDQKLEVTREVLDRIPLTAKSARPGYEGTPSRPIPGMPQDDPNKSDEELLREFREVVQLVPGVTVVEENGRRKSR